MDDTEVRTRRRFLESLTGLIGAVGALLAASPFFRYLLPSARVRASALPVRVDLTRVAPGASMTVAWRGQPVFVVRRTPQMLADLQGLEDRLVDAQSSDSLQPAAARNALRSMRPDILVLSGVCTHAGCTPLFRPERATSEFGAWWRGGFRCPCHDSRFDLAGRVFAGSPAPRNLDVPPHHFPDQDTLIVGAAGPPA